MTRELMERSPLTKETAHYYIREGLLPKPRKRDRSMAGYDDDYIGRIHLVRWLRNYSPNSLFAIKYSEKSKEIPEKRASASSPKISIERLPFVFYVLMEEETPKKIRR